MGGWFGILLSRAVPGSVSPPPFDPKSAETQAFPAEDCVTVYPIGGRWRRLQSHFDILTEGSC